ncbi:uncharacterized protein KQ657_005138 [Scheffersomyces spartinae]|uniref:C3H1-type domain-containing protein n=1 Tax=Scheffersomyces spartinae TaxID=45513 RepID=A0A9P7V9S0_9ASCO|nr:uncharacterized protein KQ657_005138 [Scheffersomyces spartinae]KAG7193939.1 hypothetical protein KQ657_005138 [Scheffersomyces spartinae]
MSYSIRQQQQLQHTLPLQLLPIDPEDVKNAALVPEQMQSYHQNAILNPSLSMTGLGQQQPQQQLTTSYSSSSSLNEFSDKDLLPDLWMTESAGSSNSTSTNVSHNTSFVQMTPVPLQSQQQPQQRQVPVPIHSNSVWSNSNSPKMPFYVSTNSDIFPLTEENLLYNNSSSSLCLSATQVSSQTQHMVSSPQQAKNNGAMLLNQKYPASEESLEDGLFFIPQAGQPLQQQQQQQQQNIFNHKHKNINTQLYKTELCASFVKMGVCPYGNKCQFAHGENELKRVDRPPKWRSKACANWAKFGTCRYGNRCCFKHHD